MESAHSYHHCRYKNGIIYMTPLDRWEWQYMYIKTYALVGLQSSSSLPSTQFRTPSQYLIRSKHTPSERHLIFQKRKIKFTHPHLVLCTKKNCEHSIGICIVPELITAACDFRAVGLVFAVRTIWKAVAHVRLGDASARVAQELVLQAFVYVGRLADRRCWHRSRCVRASHLVRIVTAIIHAVAFPNCG